MRELTLYDNFFQDLFDFRRDFDQMFNRVLSVKPWTREEFAFNFAPAVESYLDKEGKKYFCRVSLSGVDPKDVQIHVQGNVLTITGERKFARTVKDVEMLEKEIAYGKFERELTLPEGVNAEKMFAEFVDGVLEITAPVSVAALPRKIEINTVPLTKKIAA